MPKVRMNAVKMVRSGKGVRQTARYFGVSPGTITKWCRKAPSDNRCVIPTLSSRPHHSPNRIPDDIKWAIINERIKIKRCGSVIHRSLENKGIKVSLSTVNKTLKRSGLIKERSKWKRWHRTIDRPLPEHPGDLVQIDTIHLVPDIFKQNLTRIYIYTLIDVNSRWAYAEAYEKANTHISLYFLKKAQILALFKFNCIQTDHGPEFGTYFTENSKIKHRHIRVRKPNDNAHLERFNRTIQEECLKYPTDNIKLINKWLKQYLKHYNNQRLHMGINYLTPMQKLNNHQETKLAQVFPRS